MMANVAARRAIEIFINFPFSYRLNNKITNKVALRELILNIMPLRSICLAINDATDLTKG
jgi:hypothetical protein